MTRRSQRTCITTSSCPTRTGSITWRRSPNNVAYALCRGEADGLGAPRAGPGDSGRCCAARLGAHFRPPPRTSAASAMDVGRHDGVPLHLPRSASTFYNLWLSSSTGARFTTSPTPASAARSRDLPERTLTDSLGRLPAISSIPKCLDEVDALLTRNKILHRPYPGRSVARSQRKTRLPLESDGPEPAWLWGGPRRPQGESHTSATSEFDFDVPVGTVKGDSASTAISSAWKKCVRVRPAFSARLSPIYMPQGPKSTSSISTQNRLPRKERSCPHEHGGT